MSQPLEPESPPLVNVAVDFKVFGTRIHGDLPVPAGPTPVRAMLPVVTALTDAIVDIAAARSAAEGKAVSCCKGCGACCRQLVPLSGAEARAISVLVDNLPEPRKSRVLARFADAIARLEEGGLLEKLRHFERFTNSELQLLGLEYFRLSIPCPFLEDEACSIHADRPVRCREYLVTSPAECCSHPSAETIRMVPLPGSISGVLFRLEEKPGTRFYAWGALPLALEWTASQPGEPDGQTGPELLRTIFEGLSGQKVTDSTNMIPE